MSLHAAAAPRGPLLALAALVVATVLGTALARMTGLGQDTPPAAPASVERSLRFADRADGGIDVFDAAGGAHIETIAPGTNGFLRSAMRGLARERRRAGVGDAPPFRLLGHADGRLTLEDPATGRRLELEAFGATNAAAFARLLRPQGELR